MPSPIGARRGAAGAGLLARSRAAARRSPVSHAGTVSFASRGALVDGPRAASVFGLSLLAAVLWPLRENWRAARRDSFPLSYYPMFSARRRKRVRVTHLVGFDARGGRHLLPCRHVASGGLSQVRKQIRRTVEAGEAETLCAALAARLARAGTPAPGRRRRWNPWRSSRTSTGLMRGSPVSARR